MKRRIWASVQDDNLWPRAWSGTPASCCGVVATSLGATELGETSLGATGQRTLYVGLPPREAQFLCDLVRSCEVGCEMLLDPTSPGVVGVYPMRPVARQ